MINRITKRAHEVLPKLQAVTDTQRLTLAKGLTLDDAEYAEYQTIQSHAFADGTLNEDEALSMYTTLMNWHSEPTKHTSEVLAMRITVTHLVKELLDAKIQNFRKRTLPGIQRKRREARQ